MDTGGRKRLPIFGHPFGLLCPVDGYFGKRPRVRQRGQTVQQL